ncbi:hypothetical protein HYQ44_002785 [Verticillium longisporum]|nr:hypothetical protein HYQ44_002785 [Verticillium longisporum]
MLSQAAALLSIPLSLECSLEGEHKHGWKPVTLSAPVLVLVAIIEILAQQSQREGGLALSPSADDLPTYVTFGYLFLPTIIAAWFEMSKDEGATAKNSILLAYPYDFVGTVPIKAARRRHWPTFLAGTVMVIIFWLITPLQSAIMGTGIVSVKRDMAFSTNTQFEPIVEHEYLLDHQLDRNYNQVLDCFELLASSSGPARPSLEKDLLL